MHIGKYIYKNREFFVILYDNGDIALKATTFNNYLDDGNLSSEDLKDIGIASTVGAVTSTIGGTVGGKIWRIVTMKQLVRLIG